MADNERIVNASYLFDSRLRGTLKVELFDNSYLNVEETQLKKNQQFQLEVAILDPQAKRVENLQVQWLAVAAIAILSGGFFIYALIAGKGITMSLLGLLATLALASLFVAAYFYTSERKWILVTRNAHYPLLELPYKIKQRAEAEQFVATVKQAVTDRLERKGYSDDDLFAGELRMLRRLREGGILSTTHYEQAKAHMMKSHGKENSE